MTRKRFVKNLTYLYYLIVKNAKEAGCDSDLVRSACLIRPKDYKLPAGKTYAEVWAECRRILGDVYGF